MRKLTDETIIKKVKEGQIEYFSYIVSAYTNTIYRFVHSKVYDKEEVDDIVQDAFIHFYKGIANFKEGMPILPYLYQIAKNEIKMYLRSRKQVLQLNDEIQIRDEPIRWGEDEEATGILDVLSADQKKALQLVYEGYSYKEIAGKMKRPLNTVRTIIRRARLYLKKNHEKARK